MINDFLKLAADACSEFIKNKTECDGIIQRVGVITVISFIKHTFDYKFK